MSWSEQALAQFAAWGGLTPAQAADAGLFEVDDAHSIYPDFDGAAALVIPYYALSGGLETFDRDGAAEPFCRLRYLGAKPQLGFTKQKAKRYAQPGKSGTRVYFPKCLDWARIAGDIQEPIVITEGEAKALVAAYAGVTCLALGGVWNFAAGGQEGLLPELLAIKWPGRTVYIIFDSDAATNPSVIAAEARLVDELQRKGGALCTIIRLPPDGDNKEALDTFLQKVGVSGLLALAEKTAPCGALDAKVIAMNKSIAWIERDGMIWDIEEQQFIRKDNFTAGSRFSALKHITVGSKQRAEPKVVSVAATWLTHPHAQRFGEILFRPGAGPIVEGEHGKPALNMWKGWTSTPGDVTPFLRLTEFLFQNLPPDIRDIPLKLFAFKAQHPERKVPIAITLIGPEGCGKSLWCDTLAAAFRPYSYAIASSEFGGQYHGFMEKTLFCRIQEVEPKHIQQYGERLKGIISDKDQQMNEKYRMQRMIESYTMYALTSNKRAVGSFSGDNRRMLVVDCPPPGALPREVYQTVGAHGAWFKSGGPKFLLDYLLNYDLKGWEPPQEAPLTAEKDMAYREGLTLIQAVAADMKESRNENAIVGWLNGAMSWADTNINSNNPFLVGQARSIADNINHMQVRPWYEPTELAMMLPHLTEFTMGSKFDRSTPPGQISRELREAGVPYLVNKDDPRGFLWKGKIRQYLIVCDFEEWKPPMTQIEFERFMNGFATYGQTKRVKR